MCLHFLKHGGWPIWLCDIAVLLESQQVFNWDVCLGTNSRRARSIGCTIALARELLSARVPDGISPKLIATPPKWLTSAVLREWADPAAPHAAGFPALLPYLWRGPWHIRSMLSGRWRNPIQATVDCNGAFNAFPRWPYQLRNAAVRASHLFASQVSSAAIQGRSASLSPGRRRVEETGQVSL